MQKDLKEFDSKDPVFIDANIFLHHAFDINPTSVEFLKKIELFKIKAYTSALVLEEVSFKLILQSASNFLDRVTIHKVKSLLKDKEKRREVLNPVMEYMEYIKLLKESGLVIVELKDSDVMTAIQKSIAYGLTTADSTHLVIMERKGIRQIATSDNDFKTVPHITIWSSFEEKY